MQETPHHELSHMQAKQIVSYREKLIEQTPLKQHQPAQESARSSQFQYLISSKLVAKESNLQI